MNFRSLIILNVTLFSMQNIHKLPRQRRVYPPNSSRQSPATPVWTGSSKSAPSLLCCTRGRCQGRLVECHPGCVSPWTKLAPKSAFWSAMWAVSRAWLTKHVLWWALPSSGRAPLSWCTLTRARWRLCSKRRPKGCGRRTECQLRAMDSFRRTSWPRAFYGRCTWSRKLRSTTTASCSNSSSRSEFALRCPLVITSECKPKFKVHN